MAQQMAAMQVEIDIKDQAALHQAEAAQEELHRTFQEVASLVKALQLEMERRDKVTQRVARASQAEQARGVELERITVCGGSVGVLVQPGGGATLRGCEIRGAYAGLSVGSYEDITAVASVLVAHEVKVYGCSEVGLVVGGRGSAVLSDCEFSNGKEHGMGVWGDRDSRLAVTRVQCVRNGGYGLCVLNGGHAALCGTVLRGNERGSVHVVGEGSRAELWGCTLDRVATTEAGGEVALRE
ncbi:MAG: hypothetical protein WDW38_010212 [Sanguina aurantia]